LRSPRSSEARIQSTPILLTFILRGVLVEIFNMNPDMWFRIFSHYENIDQNRLIKLNANLDAILRDEWELEALPVMDPEMYPYEVGNGGKLSYLLLRFGA
jgi:hypothetical protein